MNFIDLFYQSITITPSTDLTIDPYSFMTSFYTMDEEYPKGLLHLLASGLNTQNYFFALSFCPIDCCLVLCTLKGAGKLKTGKQTYNLDENSLLLMDCREAFSIQPALLPWNYRLYFIGLEGISPYESVLIPDRRPYICKISSQSSILHFLNMLSGIPECYSSHHAFSMHRYLTELLCLLSQMVIPNNESTKGIPFYLIDLKRRLEKHYDHPFQLSDYEQYYNISRYRLCREFSAQFGKPPLKFLNSRRLDEAKEMLLTTELSISEISNRVGYENTTHFINLFKKDTGLTPNAFRKEL